jgi:methionyl aminopeptidase
MILIKTDAQIEIMRKAGRIVAETLKLMEKEIKAGLTTADLDAMAEEYILSQGAVPGFKGYQGFPATACISIDDEVVHGIPGNRKLVEGQIVSVDVGSIVDGYYGDSAATFPVGEVSEEKRKLMEVTRRSLDAAISKARAGVRLGLISSTIQQMVEAAGFSVVRELVGHGVGKSLWEEPQVPHFGPPEAGPVLQKGMVMAIEPMVNAGVYKVKQKPDGWTMVTADGRPSAHFEHTIAIRENDADILTVTQEANG